MIYPLTGGDASFYEYRCRCNKLQNEIRKESLPGIETDSRIFDLLPADLCSIKLRSQVASIWSVWSDEITTATLPSPPIIRKISSKSSSALIEVFNPFPNTKGYEIHYYWYNNQGQKETPKELPIFAGDVMPNIQDISKRAILIMEESRHVLKLPKLRSGTKYYMSAKSLVSQNGLIDISTSSEILILETGPEQPQPSIEMKYTNDKEIAISWLDVKGATEYRVELRSLDFDGNLSPLLQQKTLKSDKRENYGSHSYTIAPPG
jgi:hypothetical protein